MKDGISNFGVFSNNTISRVRDDSRHTVDDWSQGYWENGYRKMIFFHPYIDYKEYKNDLALLDDLPDGKIIEMGISFDNKYSAEKVYLLFPGIKKTWFWVDAFTDKEMEEYKKASKEYDPKSCYIDEFDISGLPLTQDYYFPNDIEDKYEELLYSLKTSIYPRHNEIYNELINNDYDGPHDIKIIGMIVQGTKEELKDLIENPHIKASSFGVITDKY